MGRTKVSMKINIVQMRDNEMIETKVLVRENGAIRLFTYFL